MRFPAPKNQKEVTGLTDQHRTSRPTATLQLEKNGFDETYSPEDFKTVFRHHPAGVAVVAMSTPEGPFGFTATSVSSVSADPGVLVFSVSAGSSARSVLEDVSSVAVNFLAEDQQQVAEAFARRGVDRFAEVGWQSLPTGEPKLDGVAAWMRGEIDQRIAVGDSLLVTVLVSQSHHRGDARPLVYVDRTYFSLGERTQTS